MSLQSVHDALQNLSLAELKALPSTIENMIAEREKAEKSAARAELEALAKSKGFDLGELFDDKPKKGKPRGTVPPKYRNPADGSQTWTGRGRKPRWIAEALDSGANLEDFLIVD